MGDARPAVVDRAPGRAAQARPRELPQLDIDGDSIRFYTEVLGMAVTDRLGEAGIWFNVNTDHHVMALMDKAPAHFHHLAFDTVDIGQMRDLLDHLARHGRWLGWGPARHGVGGNIASYVRIVEEECFVELYCDMEQLAGRPRGHASGRTTGTPRTPGARCRRARTSASIRSRSSGSGRAASRSASPCPEAGP